MIDPSLSRRLLQIAVGISAAQAILGGGLHLWLGLEGIATVARSPLEIDPTDPMAGISGMGVGRLLSGLEYGPNPANSRGAMVAELMLPALLLLWQRSVARNLVRG